MVRGSVLLKVKVKSFLYFLLTEYHAMKAYCGSGVELYAFFYLGTRWR
jgi:hypothetical protein